MRRKPEAVHEDVRVILRNLGLFDLVTLATMSRIDRYDATDVGSSGGPKPKHSISDPTGNRAVAKIEGKKVPDPVGAACKEIERAIFEMRRTSEVLLQQREYVLNPRERHRDNIVQHCEACGREVACTSSDRLRSGYCYTDYREWLKLGKPNRTQFEATVRDRAA